MLARSIRNTAAALTVAALSASTPLHLRWLVTARVITAVRGTITVGHIVDGDGYSSFPQRIPAMGLTGILPAIDLLPVLAALAFAYVGALNGEVTPNPRRITESAIRFTPTFDSAIADERHYHG